MGEAKKGEEQNVLTMVFILFKYNNQCTYAWFDRKAPRSHVVETAGHCFELLTKKTSIRDIVLFQGNDTWGTCDSTQEISIQSDARLELRVTVKQPKQSQKGFCQRKLSPTELPMQNERLSL